LADRRTNQAADGLESDGGGLKATNSIGREFSTMVKMCEARRERHRTQPVFVGSRLGRFWHPAFVSFATLAQ
jgi:hypothetical protein